MATVDRTGITPRDLSGYVTLLGERFRTAFGQDLSLDPETPQGQIIGIMALSLAEEDEGLVAIANSVDPRRAVGVAQEGIGALLDIGKKGSSKSTVTATLGGLAGTAIPAGSRTATTEGKEFITDADATIPTGSTTVDVAMTAAQAGPVPADAGTLTRVVSLVSGWDTITNAAGAVLGALEETDEAYRARQRQLIGKTSLTQAVSLRAAIIEAGATRAIVHENDTTATVTTQGLDISANSIMCIVLGGVNADIAEAIGNTKGLGVGTSGSTLVSGIRFQRVTETPIIVNVTLDTDSTFLSDGLATIRDGLAAAATQWGIGATVVVSRLYTPINVVSGHTVTALTVTLANGSSLPGTPDLDVLYTLTRANVAITIA